MLLVKESTDFGLRVSKRFGTKESHKKTDKILKQIEIYQVFMHNFLPKTVAIYS